MTSDIFDSLHFTSRINILLTTQNTEYSYRQKNFKIKYRYILNMYYVPISLEI